MANNNTTNAIANAPVNATVIKDNAPEIVLKSAKTSELLVKVEEAIAVLNGAIADDKYSVITKANKAMTEALGKLNASVITDHFDHFLKQDNPMLAAITACRVPIYAIKRTSNKMTKTDSYSIVTNTENVVDVVAMEQYANKKVFHNAQWIYWVEAFKNCLYRKVSEEVCTPAEHNEFMKKFNLSEGARACDVGANPTSMASLTKAMQAIFNCILFIPSEKDASKNAWKIDKRDVNYLITVAFGSGKKIGSIALPRDETIVRAMTVAMHRVVTNGSYTLESK